MARFLKSRARKRWLPPGTLLPPPPSPHQIFKISYVNYNESFYEEETTDSLSETLVKAQNPDTITWVDIHGHSDPKTIELIGREFGIHKLWLEDVLNTDHRPKVSELNELLFVIIKSVRDYQPENGVRFEQVSLFLGNSFVLSFQEHPDDLFLNLKKRIQEGKGRVRSSTADYLYYEIIDFIIDDYFATLEKLGQNIEDLEQKITQRLTSDIPDLVMKYKGDLLYLSKATIPIRESISHIHRSESQDIRPETKIYYQDALEHAIQVVDAIEHYRQLLGSLMDFYQSKVNLQVNEVMKVLTIFASIFIPLTFIVGVYGMNFEYMPELKWEHGYLYSWLLMTAIVGIMVIYFRKKKWF